MMNNAKIQTVENWRISNEERRGKKWRRWR